MQNQYFNMYGAKVTIELLDLGNTVDEAIKKVNEFLDWCDKDSAHQGYTYETTDYEIIVDTKQAVKWYNDHILEEEQVYMNKGTYKLSFVVNAESIDMAIETLHNMSYEEKLQYIKEQQIYMSKVYKIGKTEVKPKEWRALALTRASQNKKYKYIQ